MAPPYLADNSSAGYGQLPVIMPLLIERHDPMPETDCPDVPRPVVIRRLECRYPPQLKKSRQVA